MNSALMLRSVAKTLTRVLGVFSVQWPAADFMYVLNNIVDTTRFQMLFHFLS